MGLLGVEIKLATIFINGLILILGISCLYFFISGMQLKHTIKTLDRKNQEKFDARIITDKEEIEEQLRVKYSSELDSFEKANIELKAIKGRIKRAQQGASGK